MAVPPKPRSLTAPFPYFGGKGAVASVIWRHLGDVDRYIEPFCGSAAVLLARPLDDRWLGRYKETINDRAGFVSNFWRAVKHDPETLAQHMDWPINEVDLHSRQQWIIARGKTLVEKLEADPDYYDAQVAGWWAWGASSWIGSNWATDGRHAKPNMTPRGANRLSLDAWDNNGYAPINVSLQEYLLALSSRLRQVRVLCGDWKRCVKSSEMSVGRNTGVFLDPPYTGQREPGLYYHDETMTHEIITFCQEWGTKARIVLAGFEGEYDLPGWHLESWTTSGRAFPTRRPADGVEINNNIQNRSRERLWVSPACLPARRRLIPRQPD